MPVLVKKRGTEKTEYSTGKRSFRKRTFPYFMGFGSAKPQEDVFNGREDPLSLKRNVLVPMQNLFREDNFSFSFKKEDLFGRKVYFENYSDVRSEGKIRGMTLMGAYLMNSPI